MSPGLEQRKEGESEDDRGTRENGTPVVGAVGELSFLKELEPECLVLEVSGAPEPVAVDVLLIDAEPELRARGWALANPSTPVLALSNRFLWTLSLGRCQMTPPIDVELRDPCEFVSSVVQAARQLGPLPFPLKQRFTLTRREREVLFGLAQGKRLKAIAGDLEISENTVKQHLINARYKLGAPDRVTAVLKAVQHGLIPFPNFS